MPEGLDDIERQRLTAVANAVEEADGGAELPGFKERPDLVGADRADIGTFDIDGKSTVIENVP